MKRTVNERIKMLRNHLNLTQQEFAERVGITSTQLSRIENGDGTPQNTTIQKISEGTNVSFEWLLHEKGDFNPQVFSKKVVGNDDPWKNVAFQQIAGERDSLKKEVERLWQMISHYTSGTKPNFHQALNASGLVKTKHLRAA